jgi:hypothetical protein
VVDDEVEQDADPTSVCVGHELGELAARPEPRVAGVVVGDGASQITSTPRGSR